MTWTIAITDNGQIMGDTIPASGWDCFSKLAAIRARIPAGWQAEAYANASNDRIESELARMDAQDSQERDLGRQYRGPAGEAVGHREVI